MNRNLKISILCEDQAKMGFRDKIFSGQHGFSVFIENDRKILFDTGPTDVFIHNAELLGLDVYTADWIVLSHGHWDHTDGLKSLDPKKNEKMKVLVHPNAFIDRRKPSGEFNGMACGRNEMEKKFDLVLSKEPCQLSKGIYFLGEIPRRNTFESQKTSFFYMDADVRSADFIADDTALAMETEKGLVIVTGCSHAGICNICDYAMQVTHRNKIHAVIGGFHLLGNSDQLEKTIEYFTNNRVTHLYPMHCTDLSALSGFNEHFGIQKLCAGDTIVF